MFCFSLPVHGCGAAITQRSRNGGEGIPLGLRACRHSSAG